MSKKRSILYLSLTVFILLAFVIVYKISYHHAVAEMEEELLEQYIDLDECYYIKETDGFVTVYFADEKTVYEYTTIPARELPESVRDELRTGKKVNTVKQVYGFLENYSS